MNPPHKHAAILRAIADGTPVQVTGIPNCWHDVLPDMALRVLLESGGAMVRVKPRTITVDGVNVPAPETAEPPEGTKFWVTATTTEHLVHRFRWGGGAFDTMLLQRGLVHLTKEAAELHARALILASGGTL